MAREVDKLHIAIRQNDMPALEKLISSGTDKNAVFYGLTPLLVAISKKNEDMVLYLIDQGCDYKMQDVQKTLFPYEEAIKGNLTKVVLKFAEQGVDLSKLMSNGQTPLTFAAENKMAEMTQALLSVKANPNVCNVEDEFPLYIWTKHGDVQLARSLISSGADVNQANTSAEETALMAAIMNDMDTIAMDLIKARCRINTTDVSGWSSLRFAVMQENERIVKALMAAGADPNQADSDGQSIIEAAKELENDVIVDILKTRA